MENNLSTSVVLQRHGLRWWRAAGASFGACVVPECVLCVKCVRVMPLEGLRPNPLSLWEICSLIGWRSKRSCVAIGYRLQHWTKQTKENETLGRLTKRLGVSRNAWASHETLGRAQETLGRLMKTIQIGPKNLQ